MIWSLLNLVLLVLNKLFRTRLAIGPLGCRSNPVRCDGVAGEREYLNRLTSFDGRPVLYRRTGSLRIRSPYGNIIDKYVFSFKGVGIGGSIHMDMHFKDYRENRPLPGLRMGEVLVQSEPGAAQNRGIAMAAANGDNITLLKG